MPGQFDGDDLFFFVRKVLKCFGKAGRVQGFKTQDLNRFNVRILFFQNYNNT